MVSFVIQNYVFFFTLTSSDISFHPLGCAFKTCQFDGCEMISYGKHIEFCLAHSRVWVRVSYYFNDHIHNQYDNQYGLGTFSFVCWSLKVFYKVPLRSFSHCSTTLSFLFSFLFFDLDCVYINAEDGTRPQLKSKCLVY